MAAETLPPAQHDCEVTALVKPEQSISGYNIFCPGRHEDGKFNELSEQQHGQVLEVES